MRFLPNTTALAIALLSLNVHAQNPDTPRRAVAMEPATSIFVYEALGATPSVRLPQWLDAKAAPAADQSTAPIGSAVTADAPAQRVVQDARTKARPQ